MTEGGAPDPLVVEAAGSVRLVRLNRPEALNAADRALHRRIAEVWDELAADPGCRAVVLTGAGRAFCAGGDLNLLAEMHEDAACRSEVLAEASRIVERMVRFDRPVIAAVNGPAVGLGCSLAALSDVVLVDDRAYFADPHVTVGLVAGDGGALTWPLLTSLLRAKEFLFTGDRIGAEAAVAVGLANRVVPGGRVLEEAMVLAARIAAQPSGAVSATKRLLNKHLERAVLDILDLAIAAEALASAGEEHAAVLDKMRGERHG